jgi:hypothetical protein
MEQPETPQDPAGSPPPPGADAPEVPAKPQLPDPRQALAIPDKFRLPFHGKMVAPTAAPSAMERAWNLAQQQKRRRRRGFLMGLLFGQLLILALDLGGEFFLRTQPQIKLQAPIRVASIVFLGMAVGAAAMILAVVLIYFGMALRAMGRGKSGTVVGGIKRVVLTTLALGVSIAVILGTAWFMIPSAEWKPTVEFAREKGVEALEGTKAKMRAMLHRPPRTP